MSHDRRNNKFEFTNLYAMDSKTFMNKFLNFVSKFKPKVYSSLDNSYRP